MGEHIGHECGLALVRLRQPLSYYRERYGDPAWGLRRLYLLMEKQHNRGQDGAGVSVVKFDMPPGIPFVRRLRSDRHNALERVFDAVMRDLRRLDNEPASKWPDLTLKRRCEFLGEVSVGHLRYGTHSGKTLANCHPLMRKNSTASRNLVLAGNFNVTNSAELFQQLLDYGLSPVGDSDTQVIVERLGYSLDREHERLRAVMGPGSFRGLEGRELAREISRELNITRILRKASQNWDGGYVFCVLLGNGDAFACRDPAGIRPGFYHLDEEVFAVASERAALSNVFDVDPDQIQPLKPAHVLMIRRDGTISHEPFTEPLEERQCTFERIYFSRGNDPDIYRERRALGERLAPRVYDAIDGDLEHAVFSFIPNTAETAYMGLVRGLEYLSRERRESDVWDRVQAGTATRDDLRWLAGPLLRTEKIAHKDQRLRTFITHDAARRDLVAHIYDITRGVVQPDDTLVVLDDSIVRGTTLRESIITILSRLNPKKIIVVSSAPPIKYPDCYGIDMSQLGRFIAFEAAIALLHETGRERVLEEVERKCRAQAELPAGRMVNHVRAIYEPFSLDELSERIARLVRPREVDWGGGIQIIYQTIEGVREAMPAHRGDWYFTGDYPTPGGYRVLNRSYLNWREAVDRRAY